MNDKILVTGASGFLGNHVMDSLREYGYKNIFGIGYKNFIYTENKLGYDLTNKDYINKIFSDKDYDYVIHLAGYNGGIQFNINQPAGIFHDNTMMALNIIDACVRFKVKKFIGIVASCAYPCDARAGEDPSFLKEEDFLGYHNPDETVEGHGFAKRNMQIACKLYNRQYGLNAVCLCPTTLYGPGCFNENKTKVLNALVKKFVDAVDSEQEKVICWGTGAPMREFLYVKDAAKLIVESMKTYKDSTKPLNLGTGQEYSIANLAFKIAHLAGYKGEIEWDKTKSDGQYRKRLDIHNMLNLIPNFYPTSLENGIIETINDYKQRKVNGEFNGCKT